MKKVILLLAIFFAAQTQFVNAQTVLKVLATSNAGVGSGPGATNPPFLNLTDGAIRGTDHGDWAKFPGINFDLANFKSVVINGGWGDYSQPLAAFEVRLDALDGTIIATVQMSYIASNSIVDYVLHESNLTQTVTGTHDVYIVGKRLTAKEGSDPNKVGVGGYNYFQFSTAKMLVVAPNNSVIYVGESGSLTADTQDVLTWSSSDVNIATVDANGSVTAVAPGEVTISAATATGDKGKTKVICRAQPTTKTRVLANTATAFGVGPGATNPPFIGGAGHVGGIDNGDWAKFNAFNFDTTPYTSIRINGGNGDFSKPTAFLEVRLGSPTGNLISTVEIKYSASWNKLDYVMNDADLIASVTGTHDLYFVGKREDSNTVGVGNILWFEMRGGTSTSTINLDADALSVYPNPAVSTIMVNTKDLSGVRISIMNIHSQVIKSFTSTTQLNTIDVSNLAAGMYFLNIESNKGRMLKKVLVNN